MEMYDTLPFRNPSRQAFYTVSQKQQVFVEVRLLYIIVLRRGNVPRLLCRLRRCLSGAVCAFAPKWKAVVRTLCFLSGASNTLISQCGIRIVHFFFMFSSFIFFASPPLSCLGVRSGLPQNPSLSQHNYEVHVRDGKDSHSEVIWQDD